MDLDNNAHSVFLLYYHLIMVVKYRRRVIDDVISNRAKEIFEYIAPKYGITLEEWNHDEDYVMSCSVHSRRVRTVNLSMPIKVQAAGYLRRNIPKYGKNFGRKHSGVRAFVF